MNVGHAHPRLQKKIQEILLEKPLNFSPLGPGKASATLAKTLAEQVDPPLQISLFSNSGSEAVEAALKIARVFTQRQSFLYCSQGFHGTNLGALSVMGEKRLRHPFEPILSPSLGIPFGDLVALEKALASKKFAAFIVEPVQGEGGVVLPPPHYLQSAQERCKKYRTLFVLDEVQTGLGRTGSFFAYQQEGFVPDILVLAKALSGGWTPMGATLTSASLFKKAYGSLDRFDLHSSTFGGNALSCEVAQETLNILKEEALVENSALRGQELLRLLQENLKGHPLVQSVRGRGLMIAIVFGPTGQSWLDQIAPFVAQTLATHLLGQWVALQLLERGILCQPASQAWNILKLTPPLTLQKTEALEISRHITEVLAQHHHLLPLIRRVLQRLRTQHQKKWKFDL